ncbi:MAG: NrfD/PsrC family molybdoenzyme membrane anchor subunit [bacterium]
MWGIPIAIYLFIGGVVSGAFFTGILSEFFGGKKYKIIAKIASYLVLISIMIGLLLLILDLGSPLRFWRLLLTLSETSVMSQGVWILVAFTTVGGVIYPAFHIAENSNLPILSILKNKDGLRKFVGYIGFIFAVLTAVYTGVLLAATSCPLWSSTCFLPCLFFASAVSTGISVIILFAKKNEFFLNKLIKADCIAIIIELIIMVIFFISLAKIAPLSLKPMLVGQYSALFWIGVVIIGLILPLILELQHKTSKIAALLVLVGGLILRYVILLSGQSCL